MIYYKAYYLTGDSFKQLSPIPNLSYKGYVHKSRLLAELKDLNIWHCVILEEYLSVLEVKGICYDD